MVDSTHTLVVHPVTISGDAELLQSFVELGLVEAAVAVFLDHDVTGFGPELVEDRRVPRVVGSGLDSGSRRVR